MTLRDSPGSYIICKVCFWEDDPVQLLNPWYRGGANTASLVEAQQSFSTNGASEPRFKNDVREPGAKDVRDPEWRPATEADRKHVTSPAQLDKEQPEGNWSWYYWKK